MVSEAVLLFLFLFGATMSTAQFIPYMPNLHMGIGLQNYPVPLIMERAVQAPIIDPCEPAFIPQMPIMKPIMVPERPALSKFLMPELPVRLPEESVVMDPCVDDLPMKIVTVPEYIKPLKPIPPAPELTPARMPELPVHIDMLKPSLVIEHPVEDPCITEEIVLPQADPIIIPQPPKIPQFIKPKPVKVEVMKPMPMPFLPVHAELEIMADPCEPSAQSIMQLADFPYFTKHLPSDIAIKNEKFEEYLVPNMVLSRFRGVKDIKLVSIPYMRRV